MKKSLRIAVGIGLVMTAGYACHQASSAQPGKPLALIEVPADRARFEFDVVECFDAKYLGDTPGFTGRNGGLEGLRPSIALEDPVFRGDKPVGSVTSIVWERVRGSLTVEFDPLPGERIAVGETLWISLNTSKPAP
ncbi:MAG: hypothetical protein U0941_05220 [Planctomycetaceae bacterium]